MAVEVGEPVILREALPMNKPARGSAERGAAGLSQVYDRRGRTAADARASAGLL